LGQPPSNPAARSPLAALAMTSGAQEPRGARWLRRFLVFATPVLFLIGAVLNGPNGDNGKPTPAQYPGLAVLSLLMGLFVAGLGWYLARWRLLPAFLRAIGAAVLLAIALLFLVVSIQYAMGSPA
jgi:phosphoglycerol transferase MdoB-like AlkP superfamily enzyme